MSYKKPRILNVDGRTITIAHLDISEYPETYLLSAMAALGVTATVIDNTGFVDTNLILVGELGVDGTELRSVDGAVTAGTSITTTEVVFAHPAGSPIKKVLFDQWKVYGTDTNVFATTNLLDTTNMQVDEGQTTYVNDGTEYAYYWVVAYDSVNAVTGNNSDGVASTGYPLDTVGSLIKSALKSTRKEKNTIITDEWFMEEINDCLRYITGKLKHWSYLQSFNSSIGTALGGAYEYTMPTDAEDRNTNKSVLDVRVGTTSLDYLDKDGWDNELKNTIRTEVTTQAVATDTTLEIDNSYDVDDSGTVDVFIAGTKYTIEYTGVTRSTTAGILTGVPASGTGSITVTIPADTNVWQNEIVGKPAYFTIFDTELFIYPLPDASNDYKNVYMDYWTSRTLVNSASDVIEPPRYDAVKHWLCWKLRGLDNASGELDMNDSGWALFNGIVQDMIRVEKSGQGFKSKRGVNKISY